jgi:hypothetical protein
MSPHKCVALALGVCLIALSACGGKVSQEDYAMQNYHQALDTTDPQKVGSPEPGSMTEQEAVARFKSFYAIFSEDVIREHTRVVYAENAYFRDGYKEVRGADNIEVYFLKSAETVQECTFDIQDVAVHGGNYYFRWIMNLTTKRWKDEPIRAVGMSHVRFDHDGRVIFHQDYWDTSVIYEKVPVMGSAIRWIKKQF